MQIDTSDIIALGAAVIAGLSLIGAFLTWLTGNRAAGAAESASLSARDAVALARQSNDIAREALDLQRGEAAAAAEIRRVALGSNVTVLGFRERPPTMVRVRNEGPGIARGVTVDIVAHEVWWIGMVASMNPGETVEITDWFTVDRMSLSEIQKIVPEIEVVNPHARVKWTDQLGVRNVTKYTWQKNGVDFETEWELTLEI